MMFRTACLIVASLLLSAPAVANDAELEAMAQKYFTAIQSEGVGASSRFLHPEALSEFRSMILPIFEAQADSGQTGLAQVVFGGPKEIDEIRALDAESFTGAFLSFLGRQMEDLNVEFDRVEIVGTLHEDALRHVLTRVTVGAGGIEITEMEVLSYSRYEDSWRLQMNGKMKGIATALRASMTQQ